MKPPRKSTVLIKAQPAAPVVKSAPEINRLYKRVCEILEVSRQRESATCNAYSRKPSGVAFVQALAWEVLEGALLLAVARRCLRDPQLPSLQPIRSLHYFVPVLAEVQATLLAPDYVQYLRGKLAPFLAPLGSLSWNLTPDNFSTFSPAGLQSGYRPPVSGCVLFFRRFNRTLCSFSPQGLGQRQPRALFTQRHYWHPRILPPPYESPKVICQYTKDKVEFFALSREGELITLLSLRREKPPVASPSSENHS